jgi:hypothetical protein
VEADRQPAVMAADAPAVAAVDAPLPHHGRIADNPPPAQAAAAE